MTLDEARAVLGLERGATGEEVRKAYLRCARVSHPDRHPEADAAMRAQYAHDFDRAREARDILLLVAPATCRPAAPEPPRPAPASDRNPAPASSAPTPGSRRAARARRAQPRATDMPPRTTLRFEEFVRQTDAEGFGPGVKTGLYRDLTRVVVWSGLALVAGGVGAGMVLLAVG
ncbi:DnaJ domain-containing protein [Microbacterium sp. NPDC058021]|uniref:DnaJ domain-containing protein n=1 Tax=Microbacterium sp. NPDC058021 TaxID=3346306 RepID=UPI0036D935E2